MKRFAVDGSLHDAKILAKWMAASGQRQSSDAADRRFHESDLRRLYAQVRTRSNCDRGISGVICCLALTGASRSTWTGAGDAIASTRGLRADKAAAGGVSGTEGSMSCRFGRKSASAASRALVI
jgi:hypothetical protein